MYHCYKFKPDEIYRLAENELYNSRFLSIGFCPRCKKPVAEILEFRFDGAVNKESYSGIDANTIVLNYAEEIVCSMTKQSYRKTKSKPYGWVYGINKQLKNGKVRQYAADFYGNKELIKTY